MGYTAGGRGPTSVSGWPRRRRRREARRSSRRMACRRPTSIQSSRAGKGHRAHWIERVDWTHRSVPKHGADIDGEIRRGGAMSPVRGRSRWAVLAATMVVVLAACSSSSSSSAASGGQHGCRPHRPPPRYRGQQAAAARIRGRRRQRRADTGHRRRLRGRRRPWSSSGRATRRPIRTCSPRSSRRSTPPTRTSA